MATNTSDSEHIKSAIEAEIKLTQEYRTALIAEALTSKIDVRDYVVPTIYETDESLP